MTECICSSRTSWICSSSSAAASSTALVDLRVELGAAATDHRGRAGRRVGVGRVALLQLTRPADLLGIDVGDRDLALIGELHRAPVGQPGHGQARDLLEHLDRVQRGGEDLAGGVEELARVLAGTAVGDVAQQARDAFRAAVGDDRACPGAQPAQPLVGEHDPHVDLVRRPVLQRRSDPLAHLLAVIGVQDAIQEIAEAARLGAARETVHRAHVVGPLDDVGLDVPLPETGLGALQGEPEALLEAPHGGQSKAVERGSGLRPRHARRLGDRFADLLGGQRSRRCRSPNSCQRYSCATAAA